jgi:hypothetical protein
MAKGSGSSQQPPIDADAAPGTPPAELAVLKKDDPPPTVPDLPPPAPPAPAVAKDPDDLFVSCVPEAGPVARYVAVAPKAGPYSTAPFIGAVRDTTAEGNLRYSPDEVVLITGAEFRAFSKEYRRALADRSLRLRTREEWDKQNAG